VKPVLGSCDFEIVAGPSDFQRGDANGDGGVDISDAVGLLGCKFLGEKCPACRDAADVNDDGELDISDAIGILGFLFLGGDAPAAPGPRACGPDPSEDSIPICDYQSCRS